MGFASIFGSLLSGAASLSASRAQIAQQNKNVRDQLLAQSSENQKNREYNLMLARLQNRWNVEQWQRENDYNSPSAIMQRLRQTDLNPNLALSGGVMSGMRAAASPEMSSGASSSPQDMSAILSQRTSAESLMYGINSALEASQAASNFAAAKKSSADADKARGELQGINIDNFYKAAEKEQGLKIGETTVYLNKSMANLNEKQASQCIEYTRNLIQQRDNMLADLEKVRAQVANLDESTRNLVFDRFQRSREFDVMVRKVSAEIKRMDFQNALTDQQRRAIAETLPYELIGMQYSNTLTRYQTDLAGLSFEGQQIYNQILDTSRHTAEFMLQQAYDLDTFERICGSLSGIISGIGSGIGFGIGAAMGGKGKPVKVKGYGR